MAELVVSLVAQHIESKMKEGLKPLVKVKSEANGLLSELKELTRLYADAEGRAELSKIHHIRDWVVELRRIAYEAEDEVDTLELESSASRLLYLSLFTSRASKNLRNLKERAREVKKKLREHTEGSHHAVMSRARGSQAPKGHLPADGDFVIGIDYEIEKVVDLLIRKSELNEIQARVDKLAIVGMGGSGKTTLARSIYNQYAIKKKFHFHAWVSVSRGLDTTAVLVEILKEVRGQRSFFSWPNNDDGQYGNDPNKLVSRLNSLLKSKTCLLVLDDVWELESLDKFIALIQPDSLVSRPYTIVITSRQTPEHPYSWYIHQPQFLTNEDSWKLFSLVASNSSKALGVEYRPLATEMLRKCQGLPLAIVALGRLLKTKETMQEWQSILSQITGTEATSMYGPVNEILGLSYDLLPSYLKPCFLYLSLFPERSSIRGGTVIRMWIAEGFIECKENQTPLDNNETLEDAGRRYLQELVDHTMVQVVRKTFSGKVKTIRIHDIMRDFCILKAKELEFLTVSSFEPEANGKTSRRVTVDLSQCSSLPMNNSHLRSLVLFGKSSSSAVPERYTNKVNHIYLNSVYSCQMYKLLRVLDITGIKSLDGTLPKDIGNLIHLTYLRIRSTNIRKLPKSIGKLRNLLTLDYWDVAVDTEIQVPNVLWKLEKLRHLYLPNEMSGSVEDLKLHTLKDLVTLWGVGGGNWMLNEMGKLNSTLSRMYIHRISTEDQLKAVLGDPAMNDNCRMYALALDWYDFEINNLEALCANKSLQKLRLMGKAPDKSNIQGHQFPTSLGKLELFYTHLERWETMALLGRLAFLKVLRLSKDSFMGKEWNCHRKAFPVLEELKLTNLPKIEKWVIEKGAMPRLKKLSIVNCIKLEKMPDGLVFVQSVEKLEIERMPYKFISRLQKLEEWEEQNGGEDFHIIQYIPEVRIRDSCASLFN